MYRFHQVLNATLRPDKAMAESTPSAAMLGGIWMEAAVAMQLGFDPWLPEGLVMDESEIAKYDLQSRRVVEWFGGVEDISYQPALSWPYRDIFNRKAEGHPDFASLRNHWLIDLKTTEYPTEELLNKLLHSVQMAAYCAAYDHNFNEDCKLSIILASRLECPDPVKFNKDGSVSLSGQNADHAALLEAVTLMGEKADDRHWALAYKAPVWNPLMVGTLEPEECHELAKIGAIFLDAGIQILDSGLAEMVTRPYV